MSVYLFEKLGRTLGEYKVPSLDMARRLFAMDNGYSSYEVMRKSVDTENQAIIELDTDALIAEVEQRTGSPVLATSVGVATHDGRSYETWLDLAAVVNAHPAQFRISVWGTLYSYLRVASWYPREDRRITQ